MRTRKPAARNLQAVLGDLKSQDTITGDTPTREKKKNKKKKKKDRNA